MVSLPARLPLVFALAIALCGLVVLASAPPAHGGGATILVNSSADPGDGFCNQQVLGGCTFREAINLANSIQNSADTIIFSPAAFGSPSIELNSELPYFTDPAGVTVDGALGGDERVRIGPANNTTVNYGLVFTATESVHNITVENLVAIDFFYDSIQVCANPVGSTCEGPADAITLNNLGLGYSSAGIDIFGTILYNIQMTDVDTSLNGGSGVVIQSAGDLSGVHFNGGVSLSNGGDGYNISGNFANNISFSDTEPTNNGERGVDIAANVLSNLTISGGEVRLNSGAV